MTALEQARTALIRMAEDLERHPEHAKRIANWSLRMVYEFETEEAKRAVMVVFDRGRVYVTEPTDPAYDGCSVFRMHPEVYLKLAAEEMDGRTAVTSGALKVIKVANIPDLLKMRQLMNFAKAAKKQVV